MVSHPATRGDGIVTDADREMRRISRRHWNVMLTTLEISRVPSGTCTMITGPVGLRSTFAANCQGIHMPARVLDHTT
jgi:hypothetical protein